jgi:hypothetical protein
MSGGKEERKGDGRFAVRLKPLSEVPIFGATRPDKWSAGAGIGTSISEIRVQLDAKRSNECFPLV